MPSLKRRIANLIERVSGNLVVPPHDLPYLAERLHLQRVFAHFAVDCVFDVGANAGQYAERLRRDVGYRGPIISFEPIPELASVLRGKAAADPAWHVEQLALDREAGLTVFNVMVESQLSSLRAPAGDQPEIFRPQNSVARRIEVMRSTLAIELPRWRERLGFRRPYLKLDTQGSDLAVVEGAGESIAGFVGLQSELSFVRLYDGAIGYRETLDAYDRLGFTLSALVPNNEGNFPALVEMDAILVRTGGEPVAG